MNNGTVKKVVVREYRKTGWTKWWDNECRQQKRHVKKMYIKWKQDKVLREEYRGERAYEGISG